MPLCLKGRPFVKAPPFCAVVPIGCVAHPNYFLHPLSFVSRAGSSRSNNTAFPVGRLGSSSGAKSSLFRYHQSPPDKHKCHRGLVQLRVYLLAPRADYAKAVSYTQRGALRSNTPFKVRPQRCNMKLESHGS